jgi:uncharacterized protein (TIGR00369 family)
VPSGIERLERIALGWRSRFFGVVPHDRLDFEEGEVRYEFPVPSFRDAPDAPTFASYCCATADIACTSALLTVLGDSVAAITQGLWVHFEGMPRDARRVSSSARVKPAAGSRFLVEGYVRGDSGETIARIMANCVGITIDGSIWVNTDRQDDEPPARDTEMASLGLTLEPPHDGVVRGVLPAARKLSNGVNMLHGGAATLVAEAVSRAALDGAARWTLTDLDARFIRPIRADGRVIACCATVRHQGRSSATVAWEIFDPTNRIAVYGSTAWIRDSPPPAEPVGP